MPSLTPEQVREFLRLSAIPGLSDGAAASVEVRRETTDAEVERFAVVAGTITATLKRYAPAASLRAQREIAGLRLCGAVGLATDLLLADERGAALGGPVVLYVTPQGQPLGHRQLSEREAHGWLFQLLALHHLSTGTLTLESSLSADAATWWQRTQPTWAACQAAYAAAQFRPLLEVLTRLHAIVGVHIQTNAALWRGVVRRPCHGNPVPAHLVADGERLMLVEWDGFGLGDPALEVGRAAALAALSGELTADQYVGFVTDYLAGVRDLRDATLEERLRVFASVLPLGFSLVVLALLSEPGAVVGDERERYLDQVTRSLLWTQDTLGVEVGDPQALVAPLRQPARVERSS